MEIRACHVGIMEICFILISVLGGYLVGFTPGQPINAAHLLITLMGVLLLASGSSVFNQVQDYQMDLKMDRTAKRPLPSGKISHREAVMIATLLSGGGFILLLAISTPVAVLGVLALLSYNVLYTLWWKRHWSFGAVPGAIPGALPILMGFAASDGQVLSPKGLYLFAVLFFWQMPHFWSLAILYENDYRKGGVPVLPVVLGSKVTRDHIFLWTLAYTGSMILAPLFFKVGALYCVPAALMSIGILYELKRYMRAETSGKADPKAWLRFFLWINFSLILMLAFLSLALWSDWLLMVVENALR